MSVDEQKTYPGETASPCDVLALADEYRRAAEALLPTGRRSSPLSRAPYRLLAIHAIELYLNAYLLAAGHSAAMVRRLQHDLGSRTAHAVGATLVLRKRTLAHIGSLSERREYLTTRYDCAPAETSELNRLAASLHEVAEKVSAFVRAPQTGAR
jgi:HEPN domain-containing protein